MKALRPGLNLYSGDLVFSEEPHAGQRWFHQMWAESLQVGLATGRLERPGQFLIGKESAHTAPLA